MAYFNLVKSALVALGVVHTLVDVAAYTVVFHKKLTSKNFYIYIMPRFFAVYPPKADFYLSEKIRAKISVGTNF